MSEQIVTVEADRGDAIAGFINPLAPLRAIWRNRELLRQLIRREVVGRYRGSYLGILWALLTPLMTLAVFTLVFGGMHRRPGGGPMDYPMNLFIGIIMYGTFSEVVSRAAGLIIANPNFVKKAVFPLELLGVSAVIAGCVHTCMTLLIELGVVLYATGRIPPTALLLPVIFIPVLLLTLGICWLLAGLGVFFRDLTNAIGPCVQLLFFLTPIVYPMKVLDSNPILGRLLWATNPFVTIVESSREVLINGQMPHWRALGITTLASALVMMVGYVVFMKVRRYFADAM